LDRNNKDINKDIVAKLKQMLDEHNVHAKGFRMARDLLKDGELHDLKLKLIAERKSDGEMKGKGNVKRKRRKYMLGCWEEERRVKTSCIVFG
jgi:hypothetical protein